MAVASIPYQVKIPYGVLELQDQNIQSLKEKPNYTYYSNAGIYFLRSNVKAEIPSDRLYNATDLMTDLIAQKRKVVNYPILNYWLDIGNQEDFLKAQVDVKKLDL